MKRRTFLKGMAATAAASACAPTALLALTGCTETTETAPVADGGYNFDEIIDRTGTYSIKYGRLEKSGEIGKKIPMTIADMDFRTAPYVHEALQTRLDRDVMGYTSTPEEYYESIIKWWKMRHGWEIPREWVNFCPGVITTLCFVIECFSAPGDKVVVQTPVYDPFMNYTKRLGREVVYNPLKKENGKYQMDLEHLESVLDEKTKILILCNPQNPGGRMWDLEELKTLAHICKEHGVLVLADEIHCDLSLYGKKHIPFLTVSPEAEQNGIILTGPTKTFNVAGLHAAQCFIANKEIREKLIGYLSAHKLMEPSITCIELTMAAYNHDDKWVNDVTAYIAKNVDYACDFFEKEVPQIKCIKPEASFLLYLDCSELNLPDDELKSLFQDKAGVMVSGGPGYGPGSEGCIRLNIGCPLSVLKQALERIKNAVV